MEPKQSKSLQLRPHRGWVPNIFSSKGSPTSSLGREHYSNNYYDPDIAHPNAEYDENIEVQCPPQTSERRLIAKIDLRVIPFLSIMYRASLRGVYPIS